MKQLLKEWKKFLNEEEEYYHISDATYDDGTLADFGGLVTLLNAHPALLHPEHVFTFNAVSEDLPAEAHSMQSVLCLGRWRAPAQRAPLAGARSPGSPLGT